MWAVIRRRDLDWLAGFLVVSFGAAGLGAVWTISSVNGWYRTLRKPRVNPPDRVFGPVWTALYAQMAAAAWLVRRAMSRRPERAGTRDWGRAALVAWGVQLALNVAWSGCFFRLRSIVGGLAVIAALWAAIATTAALAWRTSRGAALLLVPYLLWVSFAAYLNFRLLQLNRG
jgi:tryptophan-rich sensory protein